MTKVDGVCRRVVIEPPGETCFALELLQLVCVVALGASIATGGKIFCLIPALGAFDAVLGQQISLAIGSPDASTQGDAALAIVVVRAIAAAGRAEVCKCATVKAALRKCA